MWCQDFHLFIKTHRATPQPALAVTFGIIQSIVWVILIHGSQHLSSPYDGEVKHILQSDIPSNSLLTKRETSYLFTDHKEPLNCLPIIKDR